MSNAVTEQEQHYKEQAAELREEGVANSESTKQVLMKRRALRRSREVRVAIEKFWKAIEYHTIDERWIPKELYYTYNIKLTKAVLAEEEDYDEEDDDPAEDLANAEEDWSHDCKKSSPAGTTSGK